MSTLLLTALAGAALAAPWFDPAVPELDDPILYPPEVYEDDPITGGELRVEGGGALVLRHTDVIAEVHAGIARVTLVQYFANPYEEPIEARYLLPLPTGAAVDRMDLTVGDRLVEGWVMERAAAKRAYEEAKEDGRRAALLEQERPNLFTQHVAGICPGERVTITVQYTEQIEYEDGLYTLAFPTTVGERFSPPWVEDAARLLTPYARSGRDLSVTVYLDEGNPVETLFSDTHAFEVEGEGPYGAVVTLDPADTVPNRDFSLTWSLAGTQPRAAVLAHRPDPLEPGYAAVTLEPQILGDLFEPRPRELLFVVDESGSMGGWPFEAARATVALSLDEMGPRDTFNLVKFSNAASSLFARPQPATEANIAAAERWMSHFAGGGTQMDEGIVHTLDMPGDPDALRLVLFLTDGFVGGEDAMVKLVARHRRGARLFSLGVGSSVNRYLLEGLAELGKGDVIYLPPGKPLGEAVDEFYGRIAHPAMSDVEIDWGAVDVYDTYPERIPDLWAGQPVRVVARYEGSGPTEVRVRGIVGTEEYEITLPVEFPEHDLSHEGLGALWARHRIRDLEWYPRGRTPAAVRAEVLDVALDHNLVSKYTSLVAIDDEPCPCAGFLREVAVPHEVPYLAPGAGGLGAGGLGAYGSGFGGGGSAKGLGGLGTRGTGYGASGYAVGGGTFGAKGDGIIASAPISSVGGDPIILGSIDRSLIDDVIKRHLNAIRYCYQRELRADPSLAGKVVVKFVIAADGSVTTAQIKTTTLNNAAVEECVRKRFLRMSFPSTPGGGIVIVSYPFLFSPG